MHALSKPRSVQVTEWILKIYLFTQFYNKSLENRTFVMNLFLLSIAYFVDFLFFARSLSIVIWSLFLLVELFSYFAAAIIFYSIIF